MIHYLVVNGYTVGESLSTSQSRVKQNFRFASAQPVYHANCREPPSRLPRNGRIKPDWVLVDGKANVNSTIRRFSANERPLEGEISVKSRSEML
jgi:hypothetical protein